jgi:hypothetical protein
MNTKFIFGLVGLFIAITVLVIIGIKNRNLDFETIISNKYVQILGYSLLVGIVIILIKTCVSIVK